MEGGKESFSGEGGVESGELGKKRERRNRRRGENWERVRIIQKKGSRAMPFRNTSGLKKKE